jgi:GntR family transcriptional regulator
MTPKHGAAELPIRVSMDDPEPMYLQIQRQLRTLVVGGYLEAGTPLPSVRQLAHDLSCSVITTRRAYQELEREGIIRTRQGMGTVVAELAADEVALHRREPVARAFSEAVTEGRQAGMNDEELQELFHEALRKHGPGRERDGIRT